MKKIIILSFLIIAALGLIGYFAFGKFKNINGVLNQPTTFKCTTDSNCKLIYSNCDCEAVPADDTRTLLESDKVCKWNTCRRTNVTAICKDNKCVRNDSKE